ncbi:O-methyltransferase [Thiohalophilus thiocyanatoxydans]|uniref:Putative O-methyltransferase YrrM n=1 Tax=Thiohalophilus thiocyanatoxydans TaxID=381308 RepID=A0A4R8IRV0_9GAMM|nr:class I SAM-dependent methyltransferase [Thiohalophilus thiocyanatoxydans]TDY03761.1 putative O-methyltransferase YrrM [Thiohalophilus thiocyanatoxydans]
MDYLLLFLLLVVLASQALLFYKVRKIHLASYRLLGAAQESGALYQQLQAYDGLMRLIRPVAPLPLLRGWAASPDLLFTLAKHTIKHKPVSILECSSGSSTMVLARCCQLNGVGHVYSLEHDEHFAEQTREGLVEQGLEEWASVIHAPLIPTGDAGQPWYDLTRLQAPEGGFDMLVIDGPPATTSKHARYPALPQLDRLLNPGARVFLDDAARGEEKQILARWQQELPHYTEALLPFDKGAAVLTKG